ncbi:MAG TPA: CoA-binding protein [bacterium]|nr:CoA-binding protein [bacterium]HNS49369.1 CoA-binding protein [bacterium]
MPSLVKEFLGQKNFAVVGSFREKTRYAYLILKDLLARGYEVYPVNPNLDEVEGRPCYKRISDIPFRIDVVDLVTPPPVTEILLEECRQLGIRRVWLQPGAESEKAIEFCHQNGIKVIHGLCVMLEAGNKKEDLPPPQF